jgi:hypothetical protein
MELEPVVRPPWLDDKFIQDALRSREGYGEIIVMNSTVKSAVGKGDNYTSTIYRVAVEFKRCKEKEETENAGLIIKGLPTEEIVAKFMIEWKAFEKETAMYHITMPAMFKILQQNAQGRKVQHLTPFCYKISGPHTLILEDLMILGFKVANRQNRLDLPHCTLVLNSLAKFHAASVALRDKNPHSMDDYVERLYVEKNRDLMLRLTTSNINALANVVEKWPGFEKYGEKLRRIIPTFWDRVTEIVKPPSNSLCVLNHGDLWVCNMMFHYDPETEIPDQVRFFDLQLPRYSSPALDLQYFMHTSSNEHVRTEYTENLLEVYHTELRETLLALGCDHHVYTLEQLKKDYEDRLLFGLFTAVSLIPIVLADPADAYEMENLVEDGRNLDLNKLEKAFSGRRYKEAFENLLPHFERKGLL